MNNLLTTILFSLLSLSALAETNDSLSLVKKPTISIQVSYNPSYMIAHEEFMSEAVQSHGVGYYDLRAKWGKRPTMQAGISYGDFSHVHMHTKDRPYRSELGHQIAIYGGAEIDYWKSGRWTMGLDLIHGLALFTHPYNMRTNADNRTIGSHFDFYINIGTFLRYRISPHWSAALGVDFKHNSNGTMWQPNLGANTIGPTVSILYDIDPQPLNYVKEPKPVETCKKENYIELLGGGSLKTIRSIFNDTYRDNLAMYGYPSFSLSLMRRYHAHHATGVGVDYTYTTYAGHLERHKEAQSGREYNYNPNIWGASLRHELIVKQISLHAALGAYIFRQEGSDSKNLKGRFYQMIGVRYTFPFLSNRLFVGYYVKAHTFSKADCTDFYLGYKLKI